MPGRAKNEMKETKGNTNTLRLHGMKQTLKTPFLMTPLWNASMACRLRLMDFLKTAILVVGAAAGRGHFNSTRGFIRRTPGPSLQSSLLRGRNLVVMLRATRMGIKGRGARGKKYIHWNGVVMRA